MREIRYIRNNSLTLDILTYGKRKRILGFPELRARKKISEKNGVSFCIRHLDTDRTLSGYGSFDPDICCCKCHLDLIGKTDDLGKLGSLNYRELISCNRGTLAVIAHFGFDSE